MRGETGCEFLFSHSNGLAPSHGQMGLEKAQAMLELFLGAWDWKRGVERIGYPDVGTTQVSVPSPLAIRFVLVVLSSGACGPGSPGLSGRARGAAPWHDSRRKAQGHVWHGAGRHRGALQWGCASLP